VLVDYIIEHGFVFVKRVIQIIKVILTFDLILVVLHFDHSVVLFDVDKPFFCFCVIKGSFKLKIKFGICFLFAFL